MPNTWDCFGQNTAQPIFNDKNRDCQEKVNVSSARELEWKKYGFPSDKGVVS